MMKLSVKYVMLDFMMNNLYLSKDANTFFIRTVFLSTSKLRLARIDFL